MNSPLKSLVLLFASPVCETHFKRKVICHTPSKCVCHKITCSHLIFQDFSTEFGMFLFAIGWLYVVMMVAVVEATSPHGSILGALLTLLFYGVVPVSIGIYIMGSSARRAKNNAPNQTAPIPTDTQP
jgi:hypothetical protein